MKLVNNRIIIEIMKYSVVNNICFPLCAGLFPHGPLNVYNQKTKLAVV